MTASTTFAPAPPVDAAVLAGWVATLGDPQAACCDRRPTHGREPGERAVDAERIDRLRVLEELKAAASAAQARIAVDFDASQRALQEAARVPASERGRGIASQIGLARRESPVAAAQDLGMAKMLVAEMPHTLARLADGDLSEWRAKILVRETAFLSRADRGIVDEQLCADPARLDGLGNRAIEQQAKKLAYQLDPEAAIARVAKAEKDRRVTCRPAPETMAHLTALLPVAQAVAAFAALRVAADAGKAAGDARSRQQLMADTMVERVTGQSTAEGVPVEVDIILTDTTLLGDHDTDTDTDDEDIAYPAHRDHDSGSDDTEEPAVLSGFGPIPAEVARSLIKRAITDPSITASLRRLYRSPRSGELVAMDSRARTFPAGLATFIRLRDQHCRTPYCDAPIRQTDHVVPHHADGPTNEVNGQGLCQACNLAKQGIRWRSRPMPDPGPHTVRITTPTGHTYHSRAPAPPGTSRHHSSPPTGEPVSPLEAHFASLILAS
ncbi:MAG: HNH endonuclease [Nocardioidaceae bacterium]